MSATGFVSPKPVLAIEGLTVSFDGFKAVTGSASTWTATKCAW